jgi:hypothetical protein
MRDAPRLRTALQVMVVLAVCVLGWIFAERRAATDRWARQQTLQADARAGALDSAYAGTEVRILNFYASNSNMMEGDRTLLCYGVVNARSVRIEPHLDGVYPAFSRCIPASPVKDTLYRLIAEGNGGAVTEASFVLPVHPDLASLPQVTRFEISNQRVDNGRRGYSISFGARNAREVSIDPEVFRPLQGAFYGHFYVAPEKTTTYTLTVTDKKGRTASRQLTIEAPEK